jgi:hypothetical protein
MFPAAAGFGIYSLLNRGPADTTSFTSENGGKAPAQGQLAPEGFDSSQDSLTQSTRALSNYTGQAGQDTFKTGQGTTEKGLKTTEEGKGALGPVMDYFSKLLSGDKAQTASAMQPQADQIASQFGQIRQMFSQTGARGGGTASTLAASPFVQEQQLADLSSQARANAADKEGQLALGEGSLGLGEAGIGLNQEGVGSNLLTATQQAYMARRGQNVTTDNSNRALGVNSINQLLSALI